MLKIIILTSCVWIFVIIWLFVNARKIHKELMDYKELAKDLQERGDNWKRAHDLLLVLAKRNTSGTH